MLDAMTADTRLKKRRSFLTNDPRRLAGVSMRSSDGRRFRDIIEALIVEFGPRADTARLRELGSLKFSLERVQALAVGGDPRAIEDLVRLSNLISRRESELRTRVAAAPIERRPLHERLMSAKPSGGRATAAKASAGRDVAATRIERMGAARREAGEAIRDDEGGDG